jgi:ankyrin repeat protein
LHEAASLGYSDIAEILIEAKADINKRDINSITPLGYAMRSGYQEIIDLLENYGAHM